ncbi:hypothetical protein B0O99DRAFT_268314 [Bisporella sp. PMI_857]|nr:hypothetical protein B0O99DRAFT_268314 [Bisporella sp. PMI_857]
MMSYTNLQYPNPLCVTKNQNKHPEVDLIEHILILCATAVDFTCIQLSQLGSEDRQLFTRVSTFQDPETPEPRLLIHKFLAHLDSSRRKRRFRCCCSFWKLFATGLSNRTYPLFPRLKAVNKSGLRLLSENRLRLTNITKTQHQLKHGSAQLAARLRILLVLAQKIYIYVGGVA